MYPIRPQENPHLFTIPEVAEILRIGEGRAYELAKQKLFPVIKIGSRVRVPKQKFFEWLENQAG
jgi:excisionase family DNA binding protein